MVDANGNPLVKLPELLSYQIKVKLTGAARETYDYVFKQLRKIIDKVVGSDAGGAKYSQMRELPFPAQLLRSLETDFFELYSRVPPSSSSNRL